MSGNGESAARQRPTVAPAKTRTAAGGMSRPTAYARLVPGSRPSPANARRASFFCHGIAPFSRGHPGREHGRAMRRRTSHLPFFFPNHEKRFCRHNQFQVFSRSQGQQKLAPIASKRQRRGTGAGKEGSSCEKATPIFPWLRQVRVAPSKPAQVSFAIRRRFVRQAGSNDIRPTLSDPGFRGLQHDWRGTEDQSRARMRTGKAMSENTEN